MKMYGYESKLFDLNLGDQSPDLQRQSPPFYPDHGQWRTRGNQHAPGRDPYPMGSQGPARERNYRGGQDDQCPPGNHEGIFTHAREPPDRVRKNGYGRGIEE